MERYFDPAERAKQKQAARDEDERQLVAGEISREELRRKNSFFAALDMSKFKMVIKERRLARRR